MRSLSNTWVLVPLLPLLLASPLGAEEAALKSHYIEADVPGKSSAFKSVGGASSRTFEEVESRLKRTDGALAKMDLSLALVAGAVETGAWDLRAARLEARSDTFAYEFKGVQARFDQVGAAYEEAFSGALARAVEALTKEGGGPIGPCTPKRGGLAALGGGGPGGAAPDSGCPGTDISAEIARRWDRDAALEARLLEIVGGDLGPLVVGVNDAGEPIPYGSALDGLGWPLVTGYQEPDAVLPLIGQPSAGPAWLHPADLVVSMPELAEALDRVDALAATARADLSATARALPRDGDGRLAQDADTVARASAIQARAKAVRQFTDEARASLGREVWEALGKLRKKGKKEGWDSVGVCVTPPAFGGCTGQDATDLVAAGLGADKKLSATLAQLAERLTAPETALP